MKLKDADRVPFHFGAPVYVQRARKIALRREAVHVGAPTARRLADRWQEVGVYAEMAAEWFTWLPINEEIHRNGDGGIDFVFHDLVDGHKRTIDVKAAQNTPMWLPLEERKVRSGKYADILVMAHVDLRVRTAWLIGWEWAARLKDCPVRILGSHDIPNHVLSCGDLRPMSELLERIDRARSLELYGRKRCRESG